MRLIARMDDSLRLVKLRLLLEALDQVPDSELHALIIQEAEVACANAAHTAFPALFFPCLFAERVRAALEAEARRKREYWRPIAPVDAELLPT
jgi:hypothetical protein